MFKKAKFIKLGAKGEWEDICLHDGTLRLGYYEVPHEAGLQADREAIRRLYIEKGVSSGAATNHARQVLDFYDTDQETVWITFSKGFLWWCQAQPKIEFLGYDKLEHSSGSRLRRSLSGWSNQSLTSRELRRSALSGRLIRVEAYQGTICEIKGEALEDLQAKLSGKEPAHIATARKARQELLNRLETLITKLTWQDFELFIDILFSKSGWMRISEVGKRTKDIDLEMILPVTGERALVQIKSQTHQNELDEYAVALQGYAADKLFFVYHTPEQMLQSKNSNLTILNISKLAEAAIRSGLQDWLIERS